MKHMTRFFLILATMGILSPVAAETDGQLTVRTVPEGIEVWLDDKYIGDTPILEKKLKPGRYAVKLIDAVRHTSLTEEIFIQPGQTTVIEKTIETKFGSLRVTSTPPGAEVYLSLPLGKTPIANDFMNPGKYRIEVRHPNTMYSSASEDIVIPRGKTVSLEKTLEKRNPFDKKALLRLALGATTIGGFVWAIVEQGNYKKYTSELGLEYNQETKELADAAAAKRVVGIVIGAVSVVGFEIVAFF